MADFLPPVVATLLGNISGQRDLLEILGRNGLRVEAGPEFAASRRAPRQDGNAGDRHGT